jgi:hypothetical protein
LLVVGEEYSKIYTDLQDMYVWLQQVHWRYCTSFDLNAPTSITRGASNVNWNSNCKILFTVFLKLQKWKVWTVTWGISLFHRVFLFTIFICSNKCTFFFITPILVSIIKSFKTLKNSYMFRSKLIIFRESPGPC